MENIGSAINSWARDQNMKAAISSWATKWLCPNCFRLGNDTALRCDHLSYVCPECLRTYGTSELPREYIALLTDYVSRNEKLRETIITERQARQELETQLAEIRKVAA